MLFFAIESKSQGEMGVIFIFFCTLNALIRVVAKFKKKRKIGDKVFGYSEQLSLKQLFLPGTLNVADHSICHELVVGDEHVHFDQVELKL